MKNIKTAIIILLILVLTLLSVLTVSADSFTVTDEGRLPFDDINQKQWCYESVCFCYANKLINGMNSYTFSPQSVLTRAQFVVMFANMESVDTEQYSISRFTDVKEGHWFYGAVAWAYDTGLVSGMTSSTFAPNEPMTRAQIATFIYNYMNGKYDVEVDVSLLEGFSDKPSELYWYYEAISYVVSAGLIQGMPDGTLACASGITRAQAARILTVFVTEYYSSGCDHFIEDAECTLAQRCVYCGLKLGMPKGHRVSGEYNCISGDTQCVDCGERVEKSSLIHSFAPATCAERETCRDCGYQRGNKTTDHNWVYAEECNQSMYCSICQVSNGLIPGHDWQEATCQKLKTCRRCGDTVSYKKDHNYKNGKCTVCGQVTAATMYDNLVAALKKQGEYDSEKNTYTYTMMYTIEYLEYVDSVSSSLIYDATKGCIVMSYLEYDDYDGYIYSLTVPVYKGQNVCAMLYMKLSPEGEFLAGGECGWRVKGWFPDTEPTFGEFYGDYSHFWDAPIYANFCMQGITADANIMIDELCGGDIECLGFDLYWKYLK